MVQPSAFYLSHWAFRTIVYLIQSGLRQASRKMLSELYWPEVTRLNTESAMEQAPPSIRVYASGRQFVVVPLVPGPDGLPVEAAPAHSVYLTMGRPVAYTLTRAIRQAQAVSGAAAGDIVTWDGDRGKWWAHSLLQVTVTWELDRIAIASGPRAKADAGVAPGDETQHSALPVDTQASEIAEWLIRHLGERLHSA
jgi:hypothetical protein